MCHTAEQASHTSQPHTDTPLTHSSGGVWFSPSRSAERFTSSCWTDPWSLAALFIDRVIGCVLKPEEKHWSHTHIVADNNMYNLLFSAADHLFITLSVIFVLDCVWGLCASIHACVGAAVWPDHVDPSWPFGLSVSGVTLSNYSGFMLLSRDFPVMTLCCVYRLITQISELSVWRGDTLTKSSKLCWANAKPWLVDVLCGWGCVFVFLFYIYWYLHLEECHKSMIWCDCGGCLKTGKCSCTF